MAEAEGRRQTGRRTKASKPGQDIPKLDIDKPPKLVSPTARLDAMTREQIARLDKENERLLLTIERLQETINRLAPENARLTAELANAESNNLVSTILVVIGGAVISYATFVGGSGPQVANIGVGLLLAGIILMLWTQANRRSRASKGS